MVSSRFAKLFAVASSAAFVCSMVGVPAYALTDTNLDEGTTGTSTGVSATPVSTDESPSLQGQPSADQVESMPDNPTKDLPQTVSEEIPDDATVVSEELAVTDDGEVMDLETGDTVTDPQIVGTVDKPADPLAKTDGESFIPVEVAEVKDAMGDTATVPEPDDAADTADTADTEDAEDDGDVAETQRDVADDGATGVVVRPASLQNNSYGAYWGTYNGTPAFFEADGTLFVQQAKGVIDVSEWQGQIDWQKAKNDGVEGVIIRISYGWDNGFDKQALRNISECKRLGIPFGIYSYSYAYDSTTAAYEGSDMVNLLRQAGVQPGDLSYPVFYDLEKWTWTGHTPPTSPSVYDGIVNAWYAKLQAAGYTNLSVYSYTNYLDTALNSANIRNKTRWVASYGTRTNFPFATNDRGWQYTSQGSVAGIQGFVDLNAFGNYRTSAEQDIRYVAKEYQSVLGNPTSNIQIGEAHHQFQFFQNGAIDWTPSTGAHFTLFGSIRNEWERNGWQHGVLGFPTSNPICNAVECYQFFENGAIDDLGGNKVFTTYGGYREIWEDLGYSSGILGFPTGNVLCDAVACYQTFEHGEIIFRDASFYSVYGSYYEKWQALNQQDGVLGYPVSDVVCDSFECFQMFDGGAVDLVNGSDEAFATYGEYRSAWGRAGWGSGALGFPVSDVTCRSDGHCYQMFQNGGVDAFEGRAFATYGEIRDEWGSSGWQDGVLGYPVSDVVRIENMLYQCFEHGTISVQIREI